MMQTEVNKVLRKIASDIQWCGDTQEQLAKIEADVQDTLDAMVDSGEITSACRDVALEQINDVYTSLRMYNTTLGNMADALAWMAWGVEYSDLKQPEMDEVSRAWLKLYHNWDMRDVVISRWKCNEDIMF